MGRTGIPQAHTGPRTHEVSTPAEDQVEGILAFKWVEANEPMGSPKG